MVVQEHENSIYPLPVNCNRLPSHVNMNSELKVDPESVKLNQQAAKYLISMWNHLVQKLLSRHTYPTNCSTWTTKVVGNRIQNPCNYLYNMHTCICFTGIMWTQMRVTAALPSTEVRRFYQNNFKHFCSQKQHSDCTDQLARYDFLLVFYSDLRLSSYKLLRSADCNQKIRTRSRWRIRCSFRWAAYAMRSG